MMEDYINIQNGQYKKEQLNNFLPENETTCCKDVQGKYTVECSDGNFEYEPSS